MVGELANEALDCTNPFLSQNPHPQKAVGLAFRIKMIIIVTGYGFYVALGLCEVVYMRYLILATALLSTHNLFCFKQRNWRSFVTLPGPPAS